MEVIAMQKILEDLYDLHIRSATYPFGIPNKEMMEEESQLYYDLCTNLSAPLKKKLLKYLDLNGARVNNQLKGAYEYGFKIAIQLITESLKE